MDLIVSNISLLLHNNCFATYIYLDLGHQLLNGETAQLACMLNMTKGLMFSGISIDFVLVCIKKKNSCKFLFS